MAIRIASKNYSTHMPVLIKVLLASEGTVVEIGGGIYSTPFLHWMCKFQNRKLVTYENHPDYYEYEKRFQSNLHRVKFVKDWDDIDMPKHISVLFIDHHPSNRRSVDTIKYKDTADYIVIHDTERDDESYDYSRIWPHFKYVYHYRDAKPYTSVVSNIIDVTKWQN